jgi:predicted nuclease of restriction endonuclease-like (RecB) superfamily
VYILYIDYIYIIHVNKQINIDNKWWYIICTLMHIWCIFGVYLVYIYIFDAST